MSSRLLGEGLSTGKPRPPVTHLERPGRQVEASREDTMSASPRRRQWPDWAAAWRRLAQPLGDLVAPGGSQEGLRSARVQ